MSCHNIDFHNISDIEAGKAFRALAEKHRVSLESLYQNAEERVVEFKLNHPVSWQLKHRIIDEYIIAPEDIQNLPVWTESIIEPGGNFERLEFEDGTVVTRLRTKRNFYICSHINKKKASDDLPLF